VSLAVRQPGKRVFYASISFAVFLLLVGIYEIATNIGYSGFTNALDSLIFISRIVASIFLGPDL
jgi:hypothetical protein